MSDYCQPRVVSIVPGCYVEGHLFREVARRRPLGELTVGLDDSGNYSHAFDLKSTLVGFGDSGLGLRNERAELHGFEVDCLRLNQIIPAGVTLQHFTEIVVKVAEPTRFAVWWKVQDGVTQPLVYAVIAVFIEVVAREIFDVESIFRVTFEVEFPRRSAARPLKIKNGF